MPHVPSFAQRRAPLQLSAELLAELERAYATPPRSYHHLGHIEELVGWFDWVEARAPWSQPREVFVAMLFHDAIYQPGARDNEARSAELAAAAIAAHAELAGIDPRRTGELIRWTARHGQLHAADVDPEAAHFLDCDLAIVGAPADRYRTYCAEIAQEYREVPAAAYRAGRLSFLTALLARPQLFLSELFVNELEATARRNLSGEVAELRGLSA